MQMSSWSSTVRNSSHPENDSEPKLSSRSSCHVNLRYKFSHLNDDSLTDNACNYDNSSRDANESIMLLSNIFTSTFRFLRDEHHNESN